jgi:hypothetical protein
MKGPWPRQECPVCGCSLPNSGIRAHVGGVRCLTRGERIVDPVKAANVLALVRELDRLLGLQHVPEGGAL